MAQTDRRQPSNRRAPSVEVIAGPGTAAETKITTKVPITSTVLRVRTTKALASPAGAFQVICSFEVPAGQSLPLNQLLVPGNTVDIRLDAGLPDSTLETVMLGWITAVEESVQLDQRGRPMRNVVLTGQDMGKFFLRHDLPGHMLTGYIMGDKEITQRLDAGLFISGLVGDVLRKLFRSVFETLTPTPLQVLEEGQLLTDPVLDGEGKDALLSWLSIDSIWTAHGKFWNTFRQYADLPWNEVFGDYIPDPKESSLKDYKLERPKQTTTLGADGGAGYYLIARRVPFDQERWDALPTTQLFDDEIKMQRLRLSDDERVNLVLVQPFGRGTRIASDQPFEGACMRSLYWDKDSTQRHGTQSFITSTIYSDLGGTAHLDPTAQRQFSGGDGPITDPVRQRARLLWGWHSVNHRLRKGTLVVAGNPHIRIGERVRHAGGGYHGTEASPTMTAYVEQVVQDFAVGSHYLTHLAVTRASDRFPEADYEGKEVWRSSP